MGQLSGPRRSAKITKVLYLFVTLLFRGPQILPTLKGSVDNFLFDVVGVHGAKKVKNPCSSW
jgi:hypothetical protein